MKFSVVIPTYNRLATLRMVLRALSTQKDAPRFEVVIVDDGSSDGSAGELERVAASGRLPFEFQVTSQRNSGPGRARNRGVEMATGDYVVFIGDDTVPEDQFLAEHHRTHTENAFHPDVACLGYTGWPAGEKVTAFMDYINDFGLQFGYELIEDGTVVPFNFFYTSNISLRRETLGPAPFDTTFPAAAWEDIELAYRLDARGLKIHYNARAVTRHYHPISVDSFARRQYTVGRSGAIFFEKHKELGHFLGVHELEHRPLPSDFEMLGLRTLARLGEWSRTLARPKTFERLMREHYLRGLRDGLAERSSGVNQNLDSESKIKNEE